MFLIGSPGPERRRLAFRFAEILKREIEYLPITRDTTESDLKQRRELRGGGVVFVDQAPVRAALHGRLLIIDGIERAERNVLPTLNNLLENREMNLEDGRTIVCTRCLGFVAFLILMFLYRSVIPIGNHSYHATLSLNLRTKKLFRYLLSFW
jgi:hypothetical protein